MRHTMWLRVIAAAFKCQSLCRGKMNASSELTQLSSWLYLLAVFDAVHCDAVQRMYCWCVEIQDAWVGSSGAYCVTGGTGVRGALQQCNGDRHVTLSRAGPATCAKPG
jgi:hypothetical protein